ncbi:hypothetical protein NIES3974_09130 [Calothrix sp. NIES-3974]|nr:hypothetical protein NIES3974_09130 [Calothrix sp. NIES-3974]
MLIIRLCMRQLRLRMMEISRDAIYRVSTTIASLLQLFGVYKFSDPNRIAPIPPATPDSRLPTPDDDKYR